MTGNGIGVDWVVPPDLTARRRAGGGACIRRALEARVWGGVGRGHSLAHHSLFQVQKTLHY